MLLAPAFSARSEEYNEALSSSALFTFNLRHYTTVPAISPEQFPAYSLGTNLDPKHLAAESDPASSIGKHLMDPFTNKTTVGRCRLTVSKPELKAPLLSALETEI